MADLRELMKVFGDLEKKSANIVYKLSVNDSAQVQQFWLEQLDETFCQK